MCVCVYIPDVEDRESRSFPPRVIRAESLGRSSLQSYLRLLSSFSREIGEGIVLFSKGSRLLVDSIRLNSIQFGEGV